MKCKFLEDHRSVSDDGFQSHGIYCSPIARIPIVAFQTLCSSFCVLSSDPFSTAVGASLSMVQWAGLGTPSHQSHQITSSYLEVSPQSGKRWVSQTFYSIRAKKETERKIPSRPECLSCFFSGDAWLYCVSKNEWKPFKHNHTQRPRLVSLNPLNTDAPAL